MKYRAGDVVQLCSGGADMTVYAGGKRTVGVMWLAGGMLQREEVPAEALRLLKAANEPRPDDQDPSDLEPGD